MINKNEIKMIETKSFLSFSYSSFIWFKFKLLSLNFKSLVLLLFIAYSDVMYYGLSLTVFKCFSSTSSALRYSVWMCVLKISTITTIKYNQKQNIYFWSNEILSHVRNLFHIRTCKVILSIQFQTLKYLSFIALLIRNTFELNFVFLNL